MCTPRKEETSGVQIFVKTLSGKTITLKVKRCDTGEDVNEKIKQKEKKGSEDQYLVYKGKVMTKDQKMQEYEIKKEDTIYVCARLRGSGWTTKDGQMSVSDDNGAIIHGWSSKIKADKEFQALPPKMKKGLADAIRDRLGMWRARDPHEVTKELGEVSEVVSEMDARVSGIYYEVVMDVVIKWKNWHDKEQFEIIFKMIRTLIENGREILLHSSEEAQGIADEEKESARCAKELIEEE